MVISKRKVLPKCGIYKITNIINNKCYVGSAVNLKKRWSDHRCSLNKNIHKNSHLQNSYNKYNKENFIFEIIEIVENKELLIEREQYYLNILKPEYNICQVAGNCLGIKRSAKVCLNISKRMKGKLSGDKHPLTHFTWEIVNEIRSIYKNDNYSYNELAKIYNVKKATIAHIIKNKTWIDHNYQYVCYTKLNRILLSSKIGEKIVKEIREEKNKNPDINIGELSIKYNISRSHIYRIWNNECWEKK